MYLCFLCSTLHHHRSYYHLQSSSLSRSKLDFVRYREEYAIQHSELYLVIASGRMNFNVKIEFLWITLTSIKQLKSFVLVYLTLMTIPVGLKINRNTEKWLPQVLGSNYLYSLVEIYFSTVNLIMLLLSICCLNAGVTTLSCLVEDYV